MKGLIGESEPFENFKEYLVGSYRLIKLKNKETQDKVAEFNQSINQRLDNDLSEI